MKLNVGTLINNRYKILSVLGQGGQSVSYLSLDTFLDRQVVLKLFDLSKISNARVQREAELLAKLNSPFIISIYDVGVYNNTFYIITSFIKGGALAFLNYKELTLKYILKVILDIASGLEYIHRNGIVHRDLKPENIIISSQGDACISDFGIGINVEEDNTITVVGSIVGTYAYISPEQVKGEKLTSSVDIYSLGVIFYELLSGERPFSRLNTYDLLKSIVNEKAPSIKSKVLDLPDSIGELIDSMLSLNPNHRPTASDVTVIISNYLKDSEETLSQTSFNLDSFNFKSHQVNFECFDRNQESILMTMLDDNFEVKASGFFSSSFFESDKARTDEFLKSINFYREHLDSQYKSLLNEARISFILWVICFAIGLIILGFSGYMFTIGKNIEGSLSLFSEIFIYFIQNMFRIREKSYRDLAEAKNKHLELGNYWNLGTQTIDGIDNSEQKEIQLKEMINIIFEIMRNCLKKSP